MATSWFGQMGETIHHRLLNLPTHTQLDAPVVLEPTPKCEICNNPSHLDKLFFGHRWCSNCYHFFMTFPRNKQTHCAFGWNCPVQWDSTRNWPSCEACCWNKITRHATPETPSPQCPILQTPQYLHSQPLRYTELQSHQYTSSRPCQYTISQTQQYIISQPLQYTGSQSPHGQTSGIPVQLSARPSTLINTDSAHSFECEICGKSSPIRFQKYGPLCCGACYNFVRLSKNRKLSYKCQSSGRCQVKYEPNKSLCGACRLKKVFHHPKFRREELFTLPRCAVTNANPTRLTDQRPSPSACDICERPNPLPERPYGALCCAYCVRFIERIITDGKPPSPCRLSTRNCQVKWLSVDPNGPCDACKWTKIVSHPSFTQKNLQAPSRSSESPVAPSDSSSVPSEVPCSICDSYRGVTVSKLGAYCKDCLDFINRTKGGDDQKCFHNEDGLIIWKAKKNRWFIMCKSKDLHNFARNSAPETDSTMFTNEKVVIESTAPVSNAGGKEKICGVCQNRNFVSFSQRYGLAICNNCYKFLRRTKKRNLTYECLAEGDCDISWRSDKNPCNFCLLQTILKHPDFLIESML